MTSETSRNTAQLKNILKSKGTDVVIGVTNHGYLEMALIWVESLKRVGLGEKYILFALDREAEEKLTELGVCTYYWECESSQKYETEAVYFDKEGEFSKITFAKTDCTHDVLKLGHNTLLADIDVIFCKNPFDFFDKSDPLEKCDIYLQIPYGPNPAWFNSGFFYSKSCPATIQLMNTSHANPRKVSGEQEFINKGLKQMASSKTLKNNGLKRNLLSALIYYKNYLISKTKPISCAGLDRDLFPTGRWWDERRSQIDPYIIHHTYQGMRLSYQERLQKIKNDHPWAR